MNAFHHIEAFRIETQTWTVAFSKEGLAHLWFPSQCPVKHIPNPDSLSSKYTCLWGSVTRSWLRAYLLGQSPNPAMLPPLDLSQGSVFQRSVWTALLSIPYGTTKSYAAIAGEVGRPRAVRALGAACGANPIPIIVPCHRVVTSHRGIGGFSAGLSWKSRLLALEKVRL